MEKSSLKHLAKKLKGTLLFDDLHRSMYATDASVYRMLPLAVACPKDEEDLQTLINFASTHKISLIPRTAGTSLAGQCVGDGIVVDVSKHFTKVLHINPKRKQVRLQAGIIRDDLNRLLAPHGLFFAPNTSSANRCMIGGMVANNSSGSTSIRYGVTRDKVLEIEALLSDGSKVVFKEISSAEFLSKTKENSLEGHIFKSIYQNLIKKSTQENIKNNFPKPSIHRRNTGYAIDAFLKCDLFGGDENTINPAKLLCGSEGTLAFFTKITLALDDVAPRESIMVCVHFDDLQASLKATLIAMRHHLYTCELMDKVILDCTKNNRTQAKNRFFLTGDPKAILMLELKGADLASVDWQADLLIEDLKKHHFGTAYPKIYGKDIAKVMELRKAGLGLLGNIVGDQKAVACIEDTAVALEDLPNYIDEFSKMMDKYQQRAVYFAHAGAGELHLRPILNLKKSKGVHLFAKITEETAKLVKKYQGSFSGEHGDGIVRSSFIPLMIGKENYELLRLIKQAFDPQNIFNKGKIIDAFPMDKSLRYEIDRKEPTIKTLQDFSANQGILRLAEKCNGSGDCRKSAEAGGVLCPSYRATKNEKDTTRARANTLREFLTNSPQENPFDHRELKEVFDLCLSCKACATECPSNVDVASLKAEFLYQYQERNGYTLRNRLFANNARYNQLGSKLPTLVNAVMNSLLAKKIMGIATARSVPKLAKKPLSHWLKRQHYTPKQRWVYLFNDEFTNFYDPDIGKDMVYVLSKMGLQIKVLAHQESGRAYISKGFLKEAQKIANQNVAIFKNIVDEAHPLIGIEPSAILTFRDEYLRLADDKKAAEQIAKNTLTIEEFLAREFKKGKIDKNLFTNDFKQIKIHGHCHQKALSNVIATFNMLNIPKNYQVSILNTGCCGMAGSFGYEKEHYEISMQVGEDTLFPKLRKLPQMTEIVAAGVSCRHQIYDGVQRIAKHPISVLREAMV